MSEQAYHAAKETSVLFDLSQRGKVELTGPEAILFLHNLCTNDVKKLAVGAGCEAFLTTAKAKVVAQFFVSRLADDLLRLDTGIGMGENVSAHLDHYLISEQLEIVDRTDEFGQLHLCGPITNVYDLDNLQGKEAFLADQPCFARRNDVLNLPGVDIFCPRTTVDQVKAHFLEQGAVEAFSDTYHVLRIEAGYPLYGEDIDENRFVVEVNRTEQAICYTKGCFLGQEPIVMARDRGQVNRKLMGLIFTAGTCPKPGDKVLHDDKEAGQVTSVAQVPGSSVNIALAYLKRGHQTPNEELDVESPEGSLTGVISELPIRIPGKANTEQK